MENIDGHWMLGKQRLRDWRPMATQAGQRHE